MQLNGSGRGLQKTNAVNHIRIRKLLCSAVMICHTTRLKDSSAYDAVVTCRDDVDIPSTADKYIGDTSSSETSVVTT